ncbi:hypothetical protein NMG60_11015226 [Bertholletia excelsa]
MAMAYFRVFFHQTTVEKDRISFWLFFQGRFQWYDDDITSISYVPANMNNTELQRRVFDFLPENVVLSAVTNGLICCRSYLPSPHPEIYICNPLNEEWVAIQWPKADKSSALGLAFDPFKDPIDKSTHFKVVRVDQTETKMEDSYFSFEIYSSKTGTWSRSCKTCQCNQSFYKNKSIFIDGTMYWLTDGYQILIFDVEEEMSWLVDIPSHLLSLIVSLRCVLEIPKES